MKRFAGTCEVSCGVFGSSFCSGNVGNIICWIYSFGRTSGGGRVAFVGNGLGI